MSTIRALLLLLLVLVLPRTSSAFDLGISIGVPPPPLPVYVQPPCPTPDYLWTPGYWAYDGGYYWVPGVWVAPPEVGLLWTPGYWGYTGGFYGWHGGYWGPHVGFYGGVNYGYGYPGAGFYGGGWYGHSFRYNTAVFNVNRESIHNTYVDRTVINNYGNNNHTSFNGPGGINATETPQERQAAGERHFQPTSEQLSHRDAASHDHNQFASVNHGRPGVTAMNSVNGRRFTQQGRIANGISSGQLNAGESHNLENREANLNGTVHADRAANGGALTGQERAQVEHRQNNISNSIYDDKHNAATAKYGNNEVGDRREEQQQRISHGIANGQLSPGEASHAEAHEQRINHQVGADRRANGGGLTPHEHSAINHHQNAASHQIHQEKHNGKKAPR